MLTKKKTPDPIDIYVGARLKQLRAVNGISQEKIGSELGITFQQIQKYENGSNRISASRLYRIARILDVEPSYFYIGYGDIEQIHSTTLKLEDKILRKVGRIAQMLNEHNGPEQEFLFKVFRDLSNGIKGNYPCADEWNNRATG